MARLKAASLIDNIELARDLLGELKLQELLAPLPADTRALFDRRLYAVEWVDADVWLPFQQAMLERHFGGDELAFRKLMHKVCERDFNTFYKVVIRLIVSPEFLLERTAKLWRTYADGGELAMIERRKQAGRESVVLRLERFQTSHAVFGVLLHAYVEQLLQMAGAREVAVERPVNRIGPDGLECELHAAYRA